MVWASGAQHTMDAAREAAAHGLHQPEVGHECCADRGKERTSWQGAAGVATAEAVLRVAGVLLHHRSSWALEAGAQARAEGAGEGQSQRQGAVVGAG